MGKAKIQNHIGDGLYLVTYYRDVSDAEKEVAALEKLRVELEKAIYKPGGYNDQLVDIEIELTNISQEFKDASDAWEECAKENCDDEAKLMAALLAVGKKKSDKIREYMELLAKISQAKAERLSASARIAFLQNTAINLAQEGMEVWCADSPHVEQQPIATGTMVGTIETYGARKVANQDVYGPDQQVNIFPSWQNAAVYSAARDHQTQTIGGQTVATALNNILEWLWVMAKKPTYEIGKLLSKNDDANVGTVECYGNTLSTGRPDLYPYDGSSSVVLTNIVFQYQNCHSRVFDPNDMVIVSYTGPNRAGSKIIGFASNPVECLFYYLQYSANHAAVYLFGDTSQDVYKGDDGTVIEVQISSPSLWFSRWTRLPSLTLYDKQYPTRQDLNVQESLNLRCDVVEVIDYPLYIDMTLYAEFIRSTVSTGVYGIKSGDTTTYCSDGNWGSGCSPQGMGTAQSGWLINFPFDGIPGFSFSMSEQFGVAVMFGVNESSYDSNINEPAENKHYVTVNYVDPNGKSVTNNDCGTLSCPNPPYQSACGYGTSTTTTYSTWTDVWNATGLSFPQSYYVVVTHVASGAKRRYGNGVVIADSARMTPM